MTNTEKKALVDRIDQLKLGKYTTNEYTDKFNVIARYVCESLHITDDGVYTVYQVYQAAMFGVIIGYAIAMDDEQKK